MKVYISKKLKRDIEDEAQCKRRFGQEMAHKIKLRMDALVAAETLADLWPPSSGPERCHELKGDLIGVFSVDLKHPYRLLFVPLVNDEVLKAEDGKQRWRAIKAVEVIRIEDTHG